MADQIKLSEAERSEIAQTLCTEINLTNAIRDKLRPRWNQNKALYYCDEAATSIQVVEGIANYPYSAWRGKCDKLVGDLTNGILSVSPVVQCIDEAPDGKNEQPLEDALELLAERSGFKRCLPLAIQQSANTNIGVLRLRPVEEKAGLSLVCDWIEPEHFMAYPVSYELLTQVKTAGHRFYRPLYDIKAKQADGTYFKGEVWGGDNPDQYDHLPGRFDRNDDANIMDMDDSYVEMWELVTTVKVKGKPTKVVAVVAKSSICLLSLEAYEYSRPWYEITRLCRTEKRIFTNDSVASSVAGPCLAVQGLLQAITVGAYTTALPVTWVSGGNFKPQVTQLKPGQMLTLPEGARAGILAQPFNADAFGAAMEKFEQIADATIGISRLGTSQNLAASTKATAINAIVSGDERRQATYLDAAAEAVEGCYALMLEYLRLHFDELAARYGSTVASCPPELLEDVRDYRLEVTGRSGASNPNTLASKLQFLMGLAQNPQSNLDYRKVELRAVDALDLPFDTSGLEKDSVTQIMQIATALESQNIDPAQVMQLGMEAFGQLHQLGGDGAPLQDPGMEGVAGVPEGGATQGAGEPFGMPDGQPEGVADPSQMVGMGIQ